MKYPKQIEEQVTYQFAQDYANWRMEVRAMYPWQFSELDEGTRVQCPKGKGTVVRYDWYPDTDTYFIVVQVAAKQFTYTTFDNIVILENQDGNR